MPSNRPPAPLFPPFRPPFAPRPEPFIPLPPPYPVPNPGEWLLKQLMKKYEKPASGIPKADLSVDVQASLGKADTAVQPAAIAGFVDGADYDAEYGDPPKPTILLKHGDEVVATVDAADFVIDGMVSNVEVKSGNLVITFNTDSGKQPISIPLADIFNPANYYTRTDVNGLLAGKASKSDLPYAFYTPTDFSLHGGEWCQDRAINSGMCQDLSAFVHVPEPIAGKSRDFFIRLDTSSKSSDVPVTVEGATLVGPDGTAIATLTAKSRSVTTWRLTEVKNGTTSPSADPVFMVTGANQAPLASPAFTGAPTAPTPASGDNSTKVATTAFVHGEVARKSDKPATFTAGNLAEFDSGGNPVDSGKSFEDIQDQIDTESPLLARSYAVPQQSGWTVDQGSSYNPIYFRPRYFGMRDGDLFKGIVLRTRSTNRTPFPSGVYMRIKRYSDGQVLGVSDLTVWPDTTSTDVVFRFSRSVELTSSGNYYVLDFSETPAGSAVNFGMAVYSLPSGTSNQDFYFIRATIVPVATAQFYSWEELTGADIAVSGTDATKIDAALAGKASKADATLTERGPGKDGFSAWTIFREGVDVTAQVAEMPRWLEEADGWLVQDTFVPGDSSSWDVVVAGQDALYLTWKHVYRGIDGVIDVVYTATRTALPGYQLGDQDDKPLASEAEVEARLAGKANKSDVDPFLFAQYYPEGNVKSAAGFTSGIKYDAPDTVNRTITVKAFCNTGTAANDNSNLVGRVVIPPFVDADGNPHISDDGTRFKVVGVSDSSTMAPGANTNLTAVVAPDTVTTVGIMAFRSCTGLTSVSLPVAEDIGSQAFYGCTSLATVSLPAATTVAYRAFRRCTSLASVSLPAAATVENDVFSDCTSLATVSLPAVTSMGDDVFGDCLALASVDFGDTPRPSVPSLGADAFDDVPASCKIIVPYMQYDAWIAADNWRDLPQEFVRHAEKADKPATFTTGNLAKFDSNGNPTDSLMPAADIVLKADLPYSFNAATVGSGTTPTVTGLANRAINYATLGSTVTAATVTLPSAVTGRSRDFYIDLTVGATTAPTLTFTDPATSTTATIAFGADSLADIAPGYNLVLFTELPNNRWLVSVKHEDVS